MMFVGFSAGARLFRQIGQDFAQSPGGGDALRERQTDDRIAASEIESVRIEACHAPRTVFGAKQLRRVKLYGVGVILIHMRDRTCLGVDELARIDNLGCDVGGGEIGGAGEAGIKVRRFRCQSPERKVSEAGIKLRLWMARKESPTHPRFLGVVTRNLCEPAEHRQARMRERIALAGRGKGTDARLSASRLAVWLERRDIRMRGEPSLSVATFTSEANGCPVLRSMVASAPARTERNNFFATDVASKSGVGAVSGSRCGMTPGCGGAEPDRFVPLVPSDSFVGVPLGAVFGALLGGFIGKVPLFPFKGF